MMLQSKSFGVDNDKLLTIIFDPVCISVAFITGVLIAFGNPVFLLLFLGTAIGIGVVSKPRVAVWVVLIIELVVSGLFELYFPSVQLVRWGGVVLSVALFVASLQVMTLSSHDSGQRKLDPSAKGLLTAAVGLIIFALIATVINLDAFSVSVIGLKNYFQMYGLLAALAVFPYTADEASKFMRFLLCLGFIQLPFVFHEFFVLVPVRSSEYDAGHFIVAVDIVAGTFGGALGGGGRTALLALFETILIVLVLAQWRTGYRSITKSALYCLVFMMPMALNEAKLFIAILPVGLFLLFRDKILNNPLKAVLLSFLVLGVLSIFTLTYTMMPSAQSQQFNGTMSDYFRDVLSYNVGWKRGYGSSFLNRSTIYLFWWSEHMDKGNYFNAIFGHGPGATNQTSFSSIQTLANFRYAGYGIGLTAISALLWEVGMLGTVAVLWLFFMAYKLGIAVEKRWQGSPHWPFICSAKIAIALFAISLFHNNLFVCDVISQTLLVLILGYLMIMSRQFPEQVVHGAVESPV